VEFNVSSREVRLSIFLKLVEILNGYIDRTVEIIKRGVLNLKMGAFRLTDSLLTVGIKLVYFTDFFA